MKPIVIPLAAVVLLGAVAWKRTDVDKYGNFILPHQLSSQEKLQIESAVKTSLPFPATALFKYPTHQLSSEFYCGLVDYKGKDGAFTGFRPFLVTSAADLRGTGVLSKLVAIGENIGCKTFGYSL